MTWPAIVFWLLILIGAFLRGPFLLYVFFAAHAFGSLQMVPGDSVGGVNLLPQSICAVFLVGKILSSHSQWSQAVETALDPTRLGLLFLFLAYSLLSAYVMPRLFFHLVEVIPISLPGPMSLEPTAANVTQSAYLALSTAVALAFAIAGEHAHFRRHYLQAMLVAGIVLIATGLVDLILTAVGSAQLLEPFRNASYVLHVTDETAGAKRVVGLMPEASAFGPACVSVTASLAFLRVFFHDCLRNLVVPTTIAVLLLMAVLSASSTAYVGLGAFGLLYGANLLRRLFSSSPVARTGLNWEILAAAAGSLAFLFVVALAPRLLDHFFEIADALVFRKSETSSYAGRMMWNQMGISTFLATDGLGAGLGSVRTSNWYLAILSNTGIVGAALLGLFLARLFLHRVPRDPLAREFVTGLKLGMLPSFIMMALAGTTPDFGVTMGAAFGLITALASAKHIPAPRTRPSPRPKACL